MASIGHFDSETVNPNAGFDPVPPGEYLVKVSNSELKTVKGKPSDKYIWLEHTILEGDYKDRKLYNNLNLWNANPTAVKIAEAMLSQLCRAVGKKQITDTVELHNLPLTCKVGLDTKGDRGPQNRIDKYLYEDTSAATVATTEAKAVVQQGAAKAPWA